MIPIGDRCRYRQFAGETSGSVSIIFALLVVVIFGAAALAVDIGRASIVAARLEASLDASALAGAKLLEVSGITDTTISQRVVDYFNGQGNILGMTPATLVSLHVTIDHNNNAVTAVASGSLPTTFAAAIGVPSIHVGKSSTVVYKLRNIELAMVLDNTGSMGDIPPGDTLPKIESLKNDANTVLDTLYAHSVNDHDVRVAIVPFSSTVNAGDYATSALATPPGHTAATGCAIERLGQDNTTDAPPNHPDELRDVAVDGGSSNDCPPASVISLTGHSQLAALKSIISTFTPQGSTAGHIGTAWGWYMLSPNWNGIFTGNSAPGPYGDAGVSKNMVIMTDGLFNTAYLTGNNSNNGNGGNGGGNGGNGTRDSYAQFDQLCANMKAAGVNIYTIGFGLTDATATTELSNCASGASNFFPVANGTELSSAFAAIVTKMNQLRVAQ